MPKRDPEAVAKSLRGLQSFLVEFGDSQNTRVVPIRALIQRLETERFTISLIEAVIRFRDETFIQVREQIWGGRTLIGRDRAHTMSEYEKVFFALSDAIYPPKADPAEVDISSFSGAEFVEQKKAFYEGEAQDVRTVVEASISLVRRYTAAIGLGNFELAHEMFCSAVKRRMSLNRLISEHGQAARQYGGPALEFTIHKVQFVLADDSSRKKTSSNQGWPKELAPELRRCLINGFWIRDKATNIGCWGTLLIGKDEGGYGIAKFVFYTQ